MKYFHRSFLFWSVLVFPFKFFRMSLMNTYPVTSTVICVMGHANKYRVCPCNRMFGLPATEKLTNLLQGYQVVQRKSRVAGLTRTGSGRSRGPG